MPVAAAGLVRRLCQLAVLSFFSEQLTETRAPTVRMLIGRDVITRGDPITATNGLYLGPRSDWESHLTLPATRSQIRLFVFISNPISTEEWSLRLGSALVAA
jgi:hypothetical protein